MAFDINRVSGVGSTIARTVPGVANMLGDTWIGEFLGLSTKNIWRLKMKDPPNTDFKGQFVAQNLTENVGQRLSNDPSLNQQDTDKKYLGGQGETITFATRIWASHSLKNVKTAIETLKGFTKRDPVLKRAPIFTFTSGTEFQCLCFVQSVGGIVYDEPRSDGTIRGATFSVALTKIEDIETPQQGMSIAALVKTGLGVVSAVSRGSSNLGKIFIPGGSLHVKGRQIITKQNQTFEHIAQIEYGDALVGDILRRAYYQKPLSQAKLSLETGDVIDLVDKDEIFQISVTPQSIALEESTVNLENIKNHFELRGEDRTIYV